VPRDYRAKKGTLEIRAHRDPKVSQESKGLLVTLEKEVQLEPQG
tara:strand:- start:290 stop:421 length:132 start_codon:yes stop_codon:yes gene_type:complete